MGLVFHKKIVGVLKEFLGAILIGINVGGRYNLNFKGVGGAGVVSRAVRKVLRELGVLDVRKTVVKVWLAEALSHLMKV